MQHYLPGVILPNSLKHYGPPKHQALLPQQTAPNPRRLNSSATQILSLKGVAVFSISKNEWVSRRSAC